jgi:hypothetical protein
MRISSDFMMDIASFAHLQGGENHQLFKWTFHGDNYEWFPMHPDLFGQLPDWIRHIFRIDSTRCGAASRLSVGVVDSRGANLRMYIYKYILIYYIMIWYDNPHLKHIIKVWLYVRTTHQMFTQKTWLVSSVIDPGSQHHFCSTRSPPVYRLVPQQLGYSYTSVKSQRATSWWYT